jgi:hypothetical protein
MDVICGSISVQSLANQVDIGASMGVSFSYRVKREPDKASARRDGTEKAPSRHQLVVSQKLNKNHVFPRACFVRDPSTSLRISLGDSDAARTAQDVLIRACIPNGNALPSSTASGLGSYIDL